MSDRLPSTALQLSWQAYAFRVFWALPVPSMPSLFLVTFAAVCYACAYMVCTDMCICTKACMLFRFSAFSTLYCLSTSATALHVITAGLTVTCHTRPTMYSSYNMITSLSYMLQVVCPNRCT
jgi:hypothetical protein